MFPPLADGLILLRIHGLTSPHGHVTMCHSNFSLGTLMKTFCALILALFLTACGQSEPPAPPKYVEMQVLDKSFMAGQSGSGVGLSSKGHLVITDNSTRDNFKLLLKNLSDQSVFTQPVDITTYSSVKVGDCLKFRQTSWEDEFQADEGPCQK